jgi:hypothetical protein
MFVDADEHQARAILRAMADVARTGGGSLTEVDVATLKGAARFVFGLPEELDPRGLPPIGADELVTALGRADLADHAAQFLAVMAVVDGTVDEEKIGRVLADAGTLGVHADYLRELAEAARHELQQVAACMRRLNQVSITGRPPTDDYMGWIMPYRDGHDEPALVGRFTALASLPPGTFGRGFADFYRINGFAYPGDAAAPTIDFAVPHDSAHVLSGYSTTPQGELLVSTFTAGMHPEQPVAGHILPVIFSWHLGIELTRFAGSTTGALQPEKFWAAWSRGAATTIDTFSRHWDFWAAAERPLDELREEYAVPHLDPRLAAEDTPPAWYHPSP